MTDSDLIERLRSFVVERGKVARGSDIVTACNNSALSLSDLRTLLAALEAAREDAARWRAVREMDGGEIYAVLGDCDGMHSELADAAIDQARGKGVKDEA